MKKKLFFVFNPHAGKAAIRSKLLDVVDVFYSFESLSNGE